MNRITLLSLIAVAGVLSAWSAPAHEMNCYWDNEDRATPYCIEDLRRARENLIASDRKSGQDLTIAARAIARSAHMSVEEAWRLMNFSDLACVMVLGTVRCDHVNGRMVPSQY